MLFVNLGPLSPTRKEIKYEFFIIKILYFSLRYSKATSTVCKVVHLASTWCIRPSFVPARPNISNVAYCWFASDVTAAMLGVKQKSVSLRWEMNSILMQILPKISFVLTTNMAALSRGVRTSVAYTCIK